MICLILYAQAQGPPFGTKLPKGLAMQHYIVMSVGTIMENLELLILHRKFLSFPLRTFRHDTRTSSFEIQNSFLYYLF